MIISSAHLFGKTLKAGVLPPPTPYYWIDDYHVDHFHDLKSPTSYNSRPCATYQAGGNSFEINTTIEDIQSADDCGVSGAKEFQSFLDGVSLDIPLYKNGAEINSKVTFAVEHLGGAGSWWRPRVSLTIYKDGVEYDNMYDTVEYGESTFRKAYIYAGVDTVSAWINSEMTSINPYLFCGIAVVYEDDVWGTLKVSHTCQCYKLDYISSCTNGGSLGADWYTRPT